ncbi:type II secretion system F family protein [Aquimarina sp. W85]|uniref:type II secretion system F family protein n=1 Tax=Aquimarina rhodophyticola TaxID=3342246 RepID=UPI0036735054
MGIKIKEHNKPIKSKQAFDLSVILTKEISIGSSFNAKKKEQWYTELHVLLKSGINLKNSLELLSETQKKEKDRILMTTMLRKLILGDAFSSIIKESRNFSKYEYHAIHIGEQTGELAQIFLELSEFYKRKNDLRKEIIAALTYPIIVLCTALLVIGFMLNFVVPMFVDIFKQNNVELPAITKGIINLSDFFSTYGWYLLIAIFIVISTLFYFSKKIWYRKFLSSLQLKIPIIGEYYRKIYMAQFTQALSLLSSAKISMVESLELIKGMINFYPLQKGLETSVNDIIKGDKLSYAFSKHTIFDKKMLAMLRVAEETNQTEYIFQKLNEQYNQQVQHQSKVISNVLNPILTILVGVIVGVILIAMYLPMFRLSSVIG